jgi:type VI secretion system secreted protein Hcp
MVEAIGPFRRQGGRAVAVDVFMVIPSPLLGTSSAVPLTADPVSDPYFSQTYVGKAAAVVELRSFSLSAENPAIVGSATSVAGVGKVKFNALQVEKTVDRLSPSLFTACAMGAHFPTVQIFIRKALGGATPGKPYLAYELSMVFINRIEWSGGGGDEAAVEQVEFAYGGLAVGYYPQQPDGSTGKILALGWSVVTNTRTDTNTLPTS